MLSHLHIKEIACIVVLAIFLISFGSTSFAQIIEEDPTREQILRKQRQLMMGNVRYTNVVDVNPDDREELNTNDGFSGDVCSTNLVGNDAAEQIFNFFLSKGLSAEQAAGIVGNLYQESNFDPSIEEYGNKVGYGIAQWSFGRRTELVSWSSSKGLNASDLGVQLEFLWYELQTSEKAAYNHLLSTSTVAQATQSFMNKFERPSAQHANLSNRLSGANGAMASFGDNEVELNSDFCGNGNSDDQ